MKLSEAKYAIIDSLEKIEIILGRNSRNDIVKIYKALIDAFPGQVPVFTRFREVYRPDITAPQLLRSLDQLSSPPTSMDQRPPVSKNAKYGNRNNPLEVRLPSRKISNWREKYEDPTLILLDSIGDEKFCDISDQGTRWKYETTGNMLYIIEAFFRRVDQLTGGLSEGLIDCAKPESEQYELADGNGLYLVVHPDGDKKWYIEINQTTNQFNKSIESYHDDDYLDNFRLKHIGNYPEISVSYARRYRDAVKHLLTQGKNPFDSKEDIEEIIDNLYDDERDVPIPRWMALALADGFKHYYSRRFLSGKKTTLDTVFGIEGDKRYEEFHGLTIDNSKLVDEARSIQWHCNLKFAPSLDFALKKINLEHEARGDNFNGNDIYQFTHALPETICQDEARGRYGSFGAWCNAKVFGTIAPKAVRDNFFGLIDALDEYSYTSLKSEIEAAMQDPHKRLFKQRIIPMTQSIQS